MYGLIGKVTAKPAIAKARPLIAGFSDRHVTVPVGGIGLPNDSASRTS
jgi:hypothetical protein